MKSLTIQGTLVFAALAAGCASAPPVNERAESTSAAIRAAEEVGASRVPSASLYLQLAKEESERAKGMINNGERERGVSLLLRAEVDADLAVALSREASERGEANAAMQRVHELQKSTP